jgi:hypothetical protein
MHFNYYCYYYFLFTRLNYTHFIGRKIETYIGYPIRTHKWKTRKVHIRTRFCSQSYKNTGLIERNPGSLKYPRNDSNF